MGGEVERIVCLGDSLTLAIGEPELAKWPVQLANRLEAESPDHYAVYLRAWNGATTAEALQRMNAEVGYLLPATVLVAYGANDALVRPQRRTAQVGVGEFISNLREIHRQIIAAEGRVVFIATHFPEPSPEYVPGNGLSYATNFRPYHEGILDLARELNSPVVDIPAELKTRGFSSQDLTASDGLHLSRSGNAVYAQIIGDVFVSFAKKPL